MEPLSWAHIHGVIFWACLLAWPARLATPSEIFFCLLAYERYFEFAWATVVDVRDAFGAWRVPELVECDVSH
jgi:hypothetical protein